jgi:signal transduction histidine kinase
MEDITVRTQTARRLQQAMAERQRLERATQQAQHFALLGRLAAGLAHEIRNPLGAVFLHVDLLEEELRDVAPASAEIPQAFTEINPTTSLWCVGQICPRRIAVLRSKETREKGL